MDTEKPGEPKPPAKPAPDPQKKPRPGFLFQLEEQRRQRRLDSLQRRFDATIQHIDQVERVNEECYRRQMDLTQAAKTGSSIPPAVAPTPFPPPVTTSPGAPPASSVFRKPWIRSLLRPPAAAAAPPAPPAAPAKPAAKKKKRRK